MFVLRGVFHYKGGRARGLAETFKSLMSETDGADHLRNGKVMVRRCRLSRLLAMLLFAGVACTQSKHEGDAEFAKRKACAEAGLAYMHSLREQGTSEERRVAYHNVAFVYNASLHTCFCQYTAETTDNSWSNVDDALTGNTYITDIGLTGQERALADERMVNVMGHLERNDRFRETFPTPPARSK